MTNILIKSLKRKQKKLDLVAKMSKLSSDEIAESFLSAKRNRKQVHLRQKIVCAYIKIRLGYGAKINESMFDLACEALKLDGYPKPPNIESRAWALLHHEVIKGRGSKKVGANVTTPDKKVFYKPKTVSPSALNVCPASKDFLFSYEWRKTRMVALKKYGAKCQCCGATPQSGAVMNVDHIKPRLTRPELALDVGNLQILCHECNHGKGNWDATDWRDN